jgi:hypothetical protein
MCIIVDTNVAARVLINATDTDFALLHKELFGSRRRVILHYGGSKFLREMKHNANVWKLLLILDQAGRAQSARDDVVDAEQAVVEELGHCTSDDPHILALARVTGARLLATMDGDLTTDFKNPSIVNKPRGKVYTRTAHENLVRTSCC